MMGIIYAAGGHVTYDPMGSPPDGFVLGRDGVWRHPDDLDAKSLLGSVRKILRVPEGQSITKWAAHVMAIVDRHGTGSLP